MKNPKITNIADLLSRKSALLTEINALNEQEKHLQDQTNLQLTALIDELPLRVGKLTGKTYSIGQIADLIVQRSKGTLGKVAAPADRTKRLSAEDQTKITEMLTERATTKKDLKIKAIAKIFNTSAQTINAYEKKRLAAILAEAARIPVQVPDPIMDAIKPETAAVSA